MFQGNRIFSYSGKEIHIILKSAFADFREIESYFGVASDRPNFRFGRTSAELSDNE